MVEGKLAKKIDLRPKLMFPRHAHLPSTLRAGVHVLTSSIQHFSFQPELEELVVDFIHVLILCDEILLQKSLDGRDDGTWRWEMMTLGEVAARYSLYLTVSSDGKKDITLLFGHLIEHSFVCI